MKANEKKKGKRQNTASTDPMILLGNRIKQLRIAKGYTSYEYFAYDHNISRAQFGRYEKGQDLRFSTLMKIIRAFDMTIAEFFAEGFD